MRKQFEYKVAGKSDFYNRIAQEFRELGEDGWELVTINSGGDYIFKREKTVQKPEAGGHIVCKDPKNALVLCTHCKNIIPADSYSHHISYNCSQRNNRDWY